MISVKGESAGLREVAAVVAADFRDLGLLCGGATAAEAWGKSIAIAKCAVCKNKKV